MQKDRSYHKAAIHYNEELASFAEKLAERVDHSVVSRWPRAVAKQHRVHAARHKKALARLEKKDQEEAALTPATVGSEAPSEEEN